MRLKAIKVYSSIRKFNFNFKGRGLLELKSNFDGISGMHWREVIPILPTPNHIIKQDLCSATDDDCVCSVPITTYKIFHVIIGCCGANNTKATFTDLRNLMRNFSTFSLACLFYFTFGPKSFVHQTSERKS